MPISYKNLTRGLRISDDLARIFDFSAELCAINPDIHSMSLSYSSVLLCFTVAPDDLCLRFRDFVKNANLRAIARYSKFNLADVVAIANKPAKEPAKQRNWESEDVWGTNFSAVFEDAKEIAKISGVREVGVRHLMAAYIYDPDPDRQMSLRSWKLNQDEWATWFLEQMQALELGEFPDWSQLDRTRRKSVTHTRPSPESADWLTKAEIESFSPQARDVISRADQVRQSYGLKMVHTLDLLLALAEAPGSQLAAFLTQAGIELNSFFSDLESRSKRVAVDEAPAEQLPAEMKGFPPISGNVRRALVLARDKAAENESASIEESHILFGLLAQRASWTVRDLNNRGITPDKVKFGPATVPVQKVDLLAGVQSDAPTGDDLLDITPEVNALASVLAAKDAGPPLALGLFGEWGSGKSFFIGRLERRIRALQDDAQIARKAGVESSYCEHIVQLTFNAWNYIDTDLWASLAAEIFEGLAAALAKRRSKDSQEERALVLAAASSSQTVLAEAERKKSAAEEELKQTQQQLAVLQNSQSNIEASLSPVELFKQAYRFALAQDEVKKPIEDAAKLLSVREGAAATGDIKTQILELHGIWKTLVFTLRHGRNLWIWFLVFAAMLGLGWGLASVLEHSALKNYIQGAGQYLVAILTAVSGFLATFRVWAQKALNFVEEAKKSKQQLIEQKEKEKTAALEAQYKEVQENVKKAKEAVAAAAQNVDKATKQLENMRADRQMADYIRQRNESCDYTQHLGIIARVRADFQHLSTLLQDVKNESDEEILAMKERQARKEAERQKEKDREPATGEKKDPATAENAQEDKEDKLFPRIDRIILYIDDLDRCPEKNVVEVLQAVHLLLAFPLFIVVVGVDPRWLLRSLEIQSAVFTVDEERNGRQKTKEEDPLWQSTPMNYLEKIFQIPFTLRPINRTGFDNLVEKFAASRKDETSLAGPPVSQTTAGAAKTKEATPAGTGMQASPVVATQLPAVPTQAPSQAATIQQPLVAVPDANAETAPVVQRATATSAPAPLPIDRNPQHLRIEEWERTFMKTLYELIPSPRAGKRFINIYRLLRASAEETGHAKFVGDARGGEYQAAQMLLAILTGHPAEATEILQKLIEEEEHPETWGTFLGSFKERVRAEAATARRSRATKPAKPSVSRAAGKTPAVSSREVDTIPPHLQRWLDLFDKLDRIKNNLNDRPCTDFCKWAKQIARYSFQSGRVLLYQRD